MLFPARISCVTLTRSQTKRLAPRLEDADPPVPLLRAAGRMVSPTVVSPTVFWRMKGWLLTPSQGRDAHLCVHQAWYVRSSAAGGGRVAWGWTRPTPGWHWGVVGMKVEGEAGRASVCLKLETEKVKQTESVAHLPQALS